MIEGKMEDCIVKNFETASKEFNFNFVTPYCTGVNNELCFFAFLYKENPKKGVIIDIISASDNRNIEKLKYCKENNLFYSCLYIDPLLGEYKRRYFSEMLKDWRYEF